MKISLSEKFEKHFPKRIKPNHSLVKRFSSRVAIFIHDPNNPILRNHRLTGSKKDFYAFSITGDIRVVYTISGDEAWFMDIGTHNQVY
jgi:addiction module RelE/StbE family toxin